MSIRTFMPLHIIFKILLEVLPRSGLVTKYYATLPVVRYGVLYTPVEL